MAWIEKENGHRVVKYAKGMSDESALKMVKAFDPDMDIIFHARISTAGGVSEELCHPFPIERVPSLQVEGTTDMVLFHNGHVTGWEQLVPEYILKMEPRNWSDSRAIAHGIAMGMLKIKDLGGTKIPGVYAVLSTDKLPDFPKHYGTIRRFGHWTLIKGGVWASNTHFLATPSFSRYVYDRAERKRFSRNYYRWEKMYSDYDKELDAELAKLNSDLSDFDYIDSLTSEEMSTLAAAKAEKYADRILSKNKPEAAIAKKSEIIFDNPSTWEPPDSWYNSDMAWDRTE